MCTSGHKEESASARRRASRRKSSVTHMSYRQQQQQQREEDPDDDRYSDDGEGEGPTSYQDDEGSMGGDQGNETPSVAESREQSSAQGDKSTATEGKKKQPKDYSDNFTSHRFSARFPPVELPKKVADTILPDCKQASAGSAHKLCFTFFGYGQRRTTHRVKKLKNVLVLVTYESLVVCEAARGELMRIIPLKTILSPVYCVLDERIVHLKVADEHDLVIHFEKPEPSRVSAPVDILSDMICDLQHAVLVDELPHGSPPESAAKMEVVEVPTGAQLEDVQLDRPQEVRYPALRMKELLRYENPREPEEPLIIPENAMRQIPATLDAFPHREETFVSTLPRTRLEDLEKRLALRNSMLFDRESELRMTRGLNEHLREEYQSLNAAVQGLRTAVQRAYEDAEQTRRREARKRSGGHANLRSQQAGQARSMQWERGSDEAEVDDEFVGQDGRRMAMPGGEQHGQFDGDDFDQDDNGYDDGALDDEGDERHREMVAAAVATGDKRALNAAVIKESKRVFRRLKVAKMKLLQAQEQAARLWTRTDFSSELIAQFQDVLLRLEFVAGEAVHREAGATTTKAALELENRQLKIELQALKLFDRASQARDERIVKAETEIALRQHRLQMKQHDEERVIDDRVRALRIEKERHLAELSAFFDAQVARSAAIASVECRSMHSVVQKEAQVSKNADLKTKADAAIRAKVAEEAAEAKVLRDELRKKSAYVNRALTSLRDENDATKALLDGLMREYGMSFVTFEELRTRLMDAQRHLAEERELRASILAGTKDQICARTEQVLRAKDEEIAQARRELYELQESLTRAAKTFGVGEYSRVSQAAKPVTPGAKQNGTRQLGA